jgi:hypothetical protein
MNSTKNLIKVHVMFKFYQVFSGDYVKLRIYQVFSGVHVKLGSLIEPKPYMNPIKT